MLLIVTKNSHTNIKNIISKEKNIEIGINKFNNIVNKKIINDIDSVNNKQTIIDKVCSFFVL